MFRSDQIISQHRHTMNPKRSLNGVSLEWISDPSAYYFRKLQNLFDAHTQHHTPPTTLTNRLLSLLCYILIHLISRQQVLLHLLVLNIPVDADKKFHHACACCGRQAVQSSSHDPAQRQQEYLWTAAGCQGNPNCFFPFIWSLEELMITYSAQMKPWNPRLPWNKPLLPKRQAQETTQTTKNATTISQVHSSSGSRWRFRY